MPKQITSLSRKLQERARVWAQDLKLSEHTKDSILRLPLAHMMDIWVRWKKGERSNQIGDNESLNHDIHGVTRMRQGNCSIRINPRDPMRRQLLTIVHEMIHCYTHPDQPDHGELHTLAAGLAYNVFPQYLREKGTMFYDNEGNILGDAADGMALDGEQGIVTIDGEPHGIVTTDGEFSDDGDFFAKRMRGLPQKMRRALGAVLQPHKALVKLGRNQAMSKKRNAGAEAAVDAAQWGGWIWDFLRAMFEANSFVGPRRGAAKFSIITNFTRYKATSWAAFREQLLQTINSQAARATKTTATSIAVAGLPTIVTLAATGSLGAIGRISDSIINTDNRPITLRCFSSGAPAVEQQYYVDIDYSKGVSDFIVLHQENDRGSGIPTALQTTQLRIDADGIRPGAVLAAETINLRELEA